MNVSGLEVFEYLSRCFKSMVPMMLSTSITKFLKYNAEKLINGQTLFK